MAVPGGTAVPHFNVWVTREAGLPLFPELVGRLPGSVGYDPESKNMLKNQADAQVEMTMEEVIAVIAAEDAREQRIPTKVRQGIDCFCCTRGDYREFVRGVGEPLSMARKTRNSCPLSVNLTGWPEHRLLCPFLLLSLVALFAQTGFHGIPRVRRQCSCG